MATWDVFQSDRLEVERALTIEAVRQALARGDLRDDDLIRPNGSTAAWVRLADLPALHALESVPESIPTPEPESEPETAPPPHAEASTQAAPAWLPPAPPQSEPEPEPEPEPAFAFDEFDDDVPPEFPEYEDDQDDQDEAEFELLDEDSQVALPTTNAEPSLREESPFSAADFEPPDDADDDSLLALPVGEPPQSETDDWNDEFDPQDEDEAIAEFTLARGSAERVEELDLAAMVDVAFQLVLFFLVTATTVLYKSLEVPKPNADSPAAAAAQGRSRSLDDLKDDYILVEIDAAGAMKIDREPVTADMAGLIERLRDAREKTGRKAMLLSADFVTPHRNAVLAYDAANEIGLGIAIARPSGGNGSEPAAPPAAKKAAQG